MKLPTYQCTRCKQTWHPRIATLPKRCAKCKSPYWNTPKTKKENRP